MMEIAIAPVRGKRSLATASMVGQKKVLPSAYTASATMAPPNVLMPLTRFKPMAASTAQMRSRPIGEMRRLFSMKCAQNRRPNMSREVKTKRILPWLVVRMFPVMFWIQPSVPSSTAPTSTWVIRSTNNSHAPIEKPVMHGDSGENDSPEVAYEMTGERCSAF